MKTTNVLICDEDKAYVGAVVGYLMGKEAEGRIGISAVGISDPKAFNSISGVYDFAVFSESFFEIYSEKKEQLLIRRVMVFSENPDDKDLEDVFYKYTNMDLLFGLINGEKRRADAGNISGVQNNFRIIGIYSPGRHELSLPFSLCLSKHLSNRNDVLFLDLSEIGILSKLMGKPFGEDLIDVIYLLENGDFGGGIEKYIYPYEGFNILSPVSTPSQLSYVTVEQWMMLLGKIRENGFRNLVILFGNLVQGFSEIASNIQEFLVIKKHGDFYAIADNTFMDFMDKLGLGNKCREVYLPLSAANLTSGGFRLESLINGRLMEQVSMHYGSS